ncbi:MAG TPA: glycosyltransferase [Pelobium sp.]|nr:glycosyltransferase [Pelobium sp.]
MKKKVFFVLGNLGAGGSERVFWMLSQYIDKSLYDVSLVLLDSRKTFLSTNINQVNIIDLKSLRASRSFFKLIKLIKKEKPYAVLTTGGHINTLLSYVSIFVEIPLLIGRESNVMNIMTKLNGFKERFWDLFVPSTYKRINLAVCQSKEIKQSLAYHYGIPQHKLVIINNPVLATDTIIRKAEATQKKLILVARLAVEKGIFRLLKIMKNLPLEYALTVAGEGPLKGEILKEIDTLELNGRVNLIGLVPNINDVIANHSLMVLSSITEGFPNVVLESLAVGVPVVAFNVSGIQDMIKPGFNGYITEQDDLAGFEDNIKRAFLKKWNHQAIKADVNERFGIEKIVKQYEALLV